MRKTKIAVTIESRLIEHLDRLVAEKKFPNRSQALELALTEKLERLERTRLARECAKLDSDQERALAEEGLETEVGTWPAY